jgi:[protein-PII] uridylyltransferase
VQSPERLRLLLILTVVDIRAVGPGVWNEWKRSLLRTLFEAAEERLRLGHKQHGRAAIVEERQEALARQLGWKASAARAHARRLPDSYWLAEPPAWQLANARQVAAAEAHIGEASPNVVVEDDEESGATRVSVFTPDREGLFYRICAGLASAGANIIDARVHTTRDGMALDNLLVLDGRGQPYADRRLRGRLVKAVERALTGDAPPLTTVEPQRRTSAFEVAPSVAIADRASTRTTVVEVNARDRPALLAALAGAIHEQGHTVHSAHIATYGERAVDVFYVTRADGKKLDADDIDRLRAALLAVAREPANEGRISEDPAGRSGPSMISAPIRNRVPAPEAAEAGVAATGRSPSPRPPNHPGKSASPEAAEAAEEVEAAAGQPDGIRSSPEASRRRSAALRGTRSRAGSRSG